MRTYERFKYCQVEDCKNVAEYECTGGCDHPEGTVTLLEIVLHHPRFLCTDHYDIGEASGAWDEDELAAKQP